MFWDLERKTKDSGADNPKNRTFRTGLSKRENGGVGNEKTPTKWRCKIILEILTVLNCSIGIFEVICGRRK